MTCGGLAVRSSTRPIPCSPDLRSGRAVLAAWARLRWGGGGAAAARPGGPRVPGCRPGAQALAPAWPAGGLPLPLELRLQCGGGRRHRPRASALLWGSLWPRGRRRRSAQGGCCASSGRVVVTVARPGVGCCSRRPCLGVCGQPSGGLFCALPFLGLRLRGGFRWRRKPRSACRPMTVTPSGAVYFVEGVIFHPYSLRPDVLSG